MSRINSTKSQKKKTKISRSAMQLFLKKGSYSGTSTSDICSGARISRPTLYHYFKNKKKLLISLHQDHIEQVLEPYLQQAVSILDPLERLTYMLRTYTCDIICRHPELRFLIHDATTIHEKDFGEIRAEWKKHYSLLRNTIAELKNNGMARDDLNESWVSLFVLGTITWMTFWFKYSQPHQIRQIGDAIIDFILRGLQEGFSTPNH